MIKNVAVVFWTGTGNTEAMANAVAEGAAAVGAEARAISVADFSADDVAGYDALAFGCPAMGAEELDMVIHVGAAKAGDWALVQRDIEDVVKAAAGHTVKVIIETCLLTDEEKVKACEAAKAAGAHFVKTSTGFSTGGATTHDIALMRKTVGPEMGVKASGGIRDYETAMAMIEAGANRIGASAGIAIVAAAE